MNQLPKNIRTTIDWLRYQLGSTASIFLFGSQTKKLKLGADYDIGIRHNGELSWKEFCLLKNEAEERAWPYKIDLVDLTRAPKEFVEVVKEEAIELR